LELLLARYELSDTIDSPFPLGGAFGYWGYDLRHPLESRRYLRARSDLNLPDCQVGFYGSLVVFDHVLERTCVIATGLTRDGHRHEDLARKQLRFWQERLRKPVASDHGHSAPPCESSHSYSSLTRAQFLGAVHKIQRYIQSGDIYQANLSQRFTVPTSLNGWQLYLRLATASPAPYAAYLNAGELQLASSSPELFLQLSGRRVQTRPIKGTRPRAADAVADRELAQELQTSAKENAELVMITDLLRNDLGKICEYGSVRVPELARLEQFAHVQHLVSTIEGDLRNTVSHLAALERCFPGGSVTGAPKLRAMQIIDELEPVGRGPYTGALGYIGFNQESQLSIIIRTAVCTDGIVHFHTGAGIVADSVPEAEYEETLVKARGFFQALHGAASNQAT
jgi:para-aminobenzoate synthetase component 1